MKKTDLPKLLRAIANGSDTKATKHDIILNAAAGVCERCEDLEDALRRIVQWSNAYPTDIFPEPTLEQSRRAHKLLTANGMTLDAFSASMARHCLKGVGVIARGALAESKV